MPSPGSRSSACRGASPAPRRSRSSGPTCGPGSSRCRSSRRRSSWPRGATPTSSPTACSTGLVAVHLGCQAVLDYHCDMALAGAVRIAVPQVEGYLAEEGGITSPDGHCRAFDARAQGTLFGSGVGAVLLKRLEDAL